jgi:hypothetical protein
VQFKITPKRILLGVALSSVFLLQITGKVIGHKFTPTLGFLLGAIVVPLAFAAALTAKPVTGATFRGLRTHMLWLFVCVVFFLLLFKLMDVLHLSWK